MITQQLAKDVSGCAWDGPLWHVKEAALLLRSGAKLHNHWGSSGRAYLSGLWCRVHLWRRGSEHDRRGLPGGKRGLRETGSDVSSSSSGRVAVCCHIILMSSNDLDHLTYTDWISIEAAVTCSGADNKKMHAEISAANTNVASPALD